MPQVQLPLFSSWTTHLKDDLAFECHDGQVTYFNGHLPVYTHAQDDLGAFRLFTSQLVVNGSATQGDIRRAFGVPKVAVQRAVDKYRAGGAAAFFVPPKARPGPVRGRKSETAESPECCSPRWGSGCPSGCCSRTATPTNSAGRGIAVRSAGRSEERRVGKECRSR